VGSLRDYSGLETADKLGDLNSGSLLLGRTLNFGTHLEGSQTGEDIYLPEKDLSGGVA